MNQPSTSSGIADQMLDCCLTRGLVEHAVEQVDVLLFFGEEVVQFEPAEISVFELGQRLEEDDRVAVAVAVEEGEAAVRLLAQRGPDQRDHRRDPGASGKADISARLCGPEIAGETAVRRHHVYHIARLQIVADPVGKNAPGDPLDGDHPVPVGRCGAQRIVAPHFLAANVRSQRQMLASLERESFAQLGRNIEIGSNWLRQSPERSRRHAARGNAPPSYQTASG